ncbi:MAG: hypothetical protein KVP17_000515 [Porospora cf. gigantea B]|nr:MAG: hypothetical protein KVP17_000515 [Porospora cf. gigantea B]
MELPPHFRIEANEQAKTRLPVRPGRFRIQGMKHWASKTGSDIEAAIDCLITTQQTCELEALHARGVTYVSKEWLPRKILGPR